MRDIENQGRERPMILGCQSIGDHVSIVDIWYTWAADSTSARSYWGLIQAVLCRLGGEAGPASRASRVPVIGMKRGHLIRRVSTDASTTPITFVENQGSEAWKGKLR